MASQYFTWVIRYVPHSIRGEFINIGVLVGNAESDWAIRYVSNFKRANLLGGDAEKLLPILRSLQQRIPRRAPQSSTIQTSINFGNPESLSVAAVENMRVHQHNVLQFSEARPSYGDSAESIAEMLYGVLVLERESEVVSRTITRLRNEYEEALEEKLTSDLEYKRHVPVSFGDRVENFDFAIHEETAVVQLTNAFNFESKDYRRMSDAVDALTLRFARLRELGAAISLGDKDRTLPFDKDRPLYVVHNEPVNDRQIDIYRRASYDWSDLGVEKLPEKELLENPKLAIAA